MKLPASTVWGYSPAHTLPLGPDPAEQGLCIPQNQTTLRPN